MKRSLIAFCLGATAASTAFAPSVLGSPVSACSTAGPIGLFDPSKDLLVANYDSKPDVDDLQAVAGLGSVLASPDFSCVDYVATAGAYGIQGGKFLPAAKLFTLAFGDRWLDAHADRDGTILQLSARMRATIDKGGQVWVAEAGQSDVTSAAVQMLPESDWIKINIVQHSYWNESQTSPNAMNFLVHNTRYHRVQDGNFGNNGSPGFSTTEQSHWGILLSDPRLGRMWAEAKRLSELHNPVADYVNPAVAAGGLDFSDTVEAAYIFGFSDMEGVEDFVTRFAQAD